LREVDKPQPKAGEVLIRIEATAINRGEIGPRKAPAQANPVAVASNLRVKWSGWATGPRPTWVKP